MKHAVLGVSVSVLLAACGGSSTAARREPEASPTPSRLVTGSSKPEGSKRFDDLTLTLELEKRTVEPDGRIDSTLVIENDSDEPVTDPMCWLSASSSGLIPVDDPAADLWWKIVVDCSGPHTMGVGYKDRRSGPEFFARTPTGEPLEPGDYFAGFEIKGLSDRILVPVTVTE